MKIIIREARSKISVGAEIKDGSDLKLPTPADGWKFNFAVFSKRPHNKMYVLTTNEYPDKIEGCLIFKMINNAEPNMAYVEIAPHNRLGKMYELVGECLIAFACMLSFLFGKDNFKGWLAFTVQENNATDQKN